MTRARVAAAIAGIVTAVLLQATLIGPAFAPLAVSLPALVVAAVALVDGPAVGMSFGFATGLATDLASRHPAGLLALCWLGLGLVCGALGERRSRPRDAATAGAAAALAGSAATLLLVAVDGGGSARDAVVWLLPTAFVGTVLGLGIVPFVRAMLHTEYLRAPQPVYTELVLGPSRGR
ncbi:hypothetical protein SAMN05443575_4276 [Jatrophihabitans endophyticus]|uniref:Rod shape-determining protein MreD n=1 Tax=Jatrophihabitans endophyticus TaxID=1206085 RepID=A0A1M5UQ78_9ACTN|nr:hypothetical protein [Jatrophihabitans endophyticus]SHH65161.1 hypothetical protein SAMN05443575_4276 [Jatrophihabitans endophyticus]